MNRTITLQIKCEELTCGECKKLEYGNFCPVFREVLHVLYFGDECIGIRRCPDCLMADVEFMKKVKNADKSA